MTALQLPGTTAIVTGASRGFGRGIAIALAQAGANVVGVARDRTRLEDLRTQLGAGFTPLVADATDPVIAGQLLDEYRPRTLVLNAGATPLPRPLHQHTWQTFSRNWEVDVQHVFGWTREALGIRFVSVLPQLTPATGLGAAGVAAYAARQGIDVTTFLEGFGPALTPEQAGKAVIDLAAGSDLDHDSFLLTAAGLTPVP
jgi:NAD(P)-dependent dehydrogenase (short-subunit alcohol dehydrogenase family)